MQKKSNVQGCDDFFHGTPWPVLKKSSNLGSVKLCQTQLDSSSPTKPLYATVFSTVNRIPLYSANRVVLHAKDQCYPRPDPKYWNRVATALCQNIIPTNPVDSAIGSVNSSVLSQCKKLQAATHDYYDNTLHLDRGHLSPNHINCRDEEKQLATFTLTNAAPQFADFNENSWRIYECVTEYTIINYVPGESVYIITGVFGSALDESGKPLWLNGNSTTGKNPVKVPGYYWKAVCYPGDARKNRDPWGYAIVQKNENKKITPDCNQYITLKEFGQKYFVDPPFGPDCMNAGFGKFEEVFSDWDNFLKTYCFVGNKLRFEKNEILLKEDV